MVPALSVCVYGKQGEMQLCSCWKSCSIHTSLWFIHFSLVCLFPQISHFSSEAVVLLYGRPMFIQFRTVLFSYSLYFLVIRVDVAEEQQKASIWLHPKGWWPKTGILAWQHAAQERAGCQGSSSNVAGRG